MVNYVTPCFSEIKRFVMFETKCAQITRDQSKNFCTIFRNLSLVKVFWTTKGFKYLCTTNVIINE